MMQVHILGSGTSTGVPVIGCSCQVCRSNHPYNQRTRASIAVQSDSQTILVDTAPELRLQLLKSGLSTVSAVLYTHMHADHTHGFDDLRAFYFRTKRPLPVYVLPEYIDEIKSRFAYAFEDTGYLGTKPQIDLRVIPNHPFHIGNLEIDPIRLPHGNVVSCGFRFGKFAYATDFKKFSEQQIEAWKGQLQVMVASGIHFGTHPTHSVIPETIELFKTLEVSRGYISHLSHEVDYDVVSRQLPKEVFLAYDAMIIDL